MIADNIAKVAASLPEGVELVAVSKTKSVDDIMEAYQAGQRAFGENYATELRDKHSQLPKDIEWHFIGHVQSKQLKYYIEYVHMIHGIDSWEHLEAVEQAAAKVGRVVDVLLQVHVAREETKFGFLPEELMAADRAMLAGMTHVRVRGVMGMASHTDEKMRVREDFRMVRRLFEQLREQVFVGCPQFDVVSMGMSGDYREAVEEGSTMVRVGSGIFGPRQYVK